MEEADMEVDMEAVVTEAGVTEAEVTAAAEEK